MACLYAILLTPLIVGSRYLFPFVFPKAVYFQTLVEFGLVLYFALLAIDRSYAPRPTLIFWGIVAYVAAILFSTVFGVDPSFSFWSKAERMDGLFQYLHLLAYFVILTGVVRREDEWLRLLKAALGIGVVVGSVALASKYFPAVVNFGNQERLGGTFGNPAFLATHFVILTFIALTFWLREKKKEVKILLSGLTLFFLWLLYLSGTRGAYIGFVVGIGVLVVGLMVGDWRRWKNLGVAVLAMFLVAVGLLYFGRNTIFKNSEFIQDRIYSISFKAAPARLIAWKIAAEAFRARPLFGWGQENFIYAFNTHFDPAIHTYDLSLFDRSHNKLTDLLTMNGIPGLASYLFLFAAMAFSMVGVMKKQVVNPVWPSGFLALTAAYLVQNLVLFEMPTSGIMLFFFAAFMSWLTAEAKQPRNNALRSGPLLSEWLIAPVILLVIAAQFAGIWQPIRMARAVVSTASAFSYPNVSMETRIAQGFKIYKQTRGSFSTFLDREFDTLISRKVKETFPNGAAAADTSRDYRALTDALIVNLEQDFKKHPLDYDVMIEIGKNYFALGSIDQSYIARALDAFEKAKSMAPKREDAYTNLAIFYMTTNNFPKADEELKKLIALNDQVGLFWWYRVIYELFKNNPQGVEWALAMAESRQMRYDWRHSPQSLTFLATTFERYKNMPEAVKYYGLLAVATATSSPDTSLQVLDKAFGLAANSGLGVQALRIKDEILVLAADERKPQIEALARKYGF